ncbi:protein arginine kinase [Cerasicoccus arenae]|nr:protein arginine kinase [Cerasicoccus arenae]MBK1857916.1 protein arginine kinase [Cerasicoccus arenae]
MQIQPLIDGRSELTHAAEPPQEVIISTRVRLARNLQGHAFPGWAKAAQRRAVLSECEETIAGLAQMQKGAVLEIENLSDLEKQVLVERHLISRELSAHGAGSGVVVSPDQSTSIMINEEDHLRIQVLRSGYHFNDIWNAIDAIDSSLESSLNYAFSENLGYLTACPTNVGTGLRASVMMHLPGLVLANQMEKVVRAVNQLGMVVRGLFGEGSDASGSLFQISNQQTLGESEQDIIRRLGIVIETIKEQEINARLRLIENEPEKLADKIGRAYGILQHGHVLSSSEAMNFLSLIRLAVDCGLLPVEQRAQVDRLFLECQPGHIQFAAKENIDSDGRDTARARMLRKETGDMPSLNFDKLAFS